MPPPTSDCFNLLDGHEVKVFTNSSRGLGQLAIRLAPFDALVLIRERTALPARCWPNCRT
jgi:D-3-phosphoglycerate dehydrogenase